MLKPYRVTIEGLNKRTGKRWLLSFFALADDESHASEIVQNDFDFSNLEIENTSVIEADYFAVCTNSKEVI